MTIQQTHNFVRADGKVPTISFSAWVATLTSEEKAEFNIAAAKQKAIMDAEKASGNLISNTGNTQVWRDGPVKPDAEWLVWFNRYLSETNTAHTIIV